MLSDTPPTYVGTKRRTGPIDFHINKMRALNLSAKYMKKVEAELRGLPGTFNDLPVTPLMNIGEMVDSSAFDQVNKATADALKGKRMREMASKTAKQASGSARRAAESVADAGARATQAQQRRMEMVRRVQERIRAEQQRRREARFTFPFPRYDDAWGPLPRDGM